MTQRRRGFMLIVALFVVLLIGIALSLLARHFVGLTRTSQGTMVDVRAAQLLASGQEWALAHPAECRLLAPGAAIDLPVTDTVPPAASASLRITRGRDDVLITARVQQGRRSATRQLGWSAASTRPAQS